MSILMTVGLLLVAFCFTHLRRLYETFKNRQTILKMLGGAFGLAIGAIPSKNVPDLLKLLTDRFSSERQGDEGFSSFIQRIGKKEVRKHRDRASCHVTCAGTIG